MRTGITGTLAALVIGLAATTTTTPAEGQFTPLPPPCSLATLRGAYGLEWVGTRPAPGNPAVIETFTGVAIRTFDGAGGFTQISNVKGSVSGLAPEDIESVGTYEVNEDCSGTARSQFTPGSPVVTVRFVIVDKGDEVLYSVMTPVPFFNAGVIRKIGR